MATRSHHYIAVTEKLTLRKQAT